MELKQHFNKNFLFLFLLTLTLSFSALVNVDSVECNKIINHDELKPREDFPNPSARFIYLREGDYLLYTIGNLVEILKVNKINLYKRYTLFSLYNQFSLVKTFTLSFVPTITSLKGSLLNIILIDIRGTLNPSYFKYPPPQVVLVVPEENQTFRIPHNKKISEYACYKILEVNFSLVEISTTISTQPGMCIEYTSSSYNYLIKNVGELNSKDGLGFYVEVYYSKKYYISNLTTYRLLNSTLYLEIKDKVLARPNSIILDGANLSIITLKDKVFFKISKLNQLQFTKCKYSDNGLDPWLKGSVVKGNKIYGDYCSKTSDLLIEFYCQKIW